MSKPNRAGMIEGYANRPIARYPALDGLCLDCTPGGQLVAQTMAGLIELMRVASPDDVSAVLERCPPGQRHWARKLTDAQRVACWETFCAAHALGKPYANDWHPCPCAAAPPPAPDLFTL